MLKPTTSESEKPKRRPGRPVGTTKQTQMLPVKLTIRPDQRDKLDTLGGSKWVRAQIDKAVI